MARLRQLLSGRVGGPFFTTKNAKVAKKGARPLAPWWCNSAAPAASTTPTAWSTLGRRFRTVHESDVMDQKRPYRIVAFERS